MLANPDKWYVAVGYYINIFGHLDRIDTNPFKGDSASSIGKEITDLEEVARFRIELANSMEKLELTSLEVYELEKPILKIVKSL